MNRDFLQHLFDKQQRVEAVPSNRAISDWATHIISLLYPERAASGVITVAELEARFVALEQELVRILDGTQACKDCNNADRSSNFFRGLNDLYQV